MEVRHDEKTDDSNDDTPEFDLLIRGDAARHIVGNRLIKQNHSAASQKDK